MTARIVLAHLPHKRPSVLYTICDAKIIFICLYFTKHRVWVFKCRLHSDNIIKAEGRHGRDREFPGSSVIAVSEGGRERFAANVLVCVLCCVQSLSVQCL